MNKLFIVALFLFSASTFAQSSMRRCTLLPVTDSVGGAIGFKVFEEVEFQLKKSDWCTYVSNSGMLGLFSKYRENLPRYLKNKEVIKTVADKLNVGSIIRIGIINEVEGAELQMEVYGENGEDVYFGSVAALRSSEIEEITSTVDEWLDTYAKSIPYEAVVTGILGDQVTLEVAKGLLAKKGQKFLVMRPVSKKKHPLLKKIVDWETKELAEGRIQNVSDNQAVGLVKVYKSDEKLAVGDWATIDKMPQGFITEKGIEEKKEEEPGKLGVLSLAVFGTSSSVDTTTPTGSNRMSGNLLGLNFRVEGWITRQYFASLEVARTIGGLRKSSGSPEKSSINANNGLYKFTGGYKYLPIGFFYGPQIDIYAGYARHAFDLDVSENDGFGANNISGFLVGVGANVPINREFKFFIQGEFIPFPTFNDDDGIYGSAKSVSAMELELGMRYQYTARMTIDGSIETLSRKAKFSSGFKEVSYKDNLLKLGVSFNF